MAEGRWVEFPMMNDAVHARQEFACRPGTKATIAISGLGNFVLYCNGKPVSDDKFVPGCSDYHERELAHLIYPINDKFSHRVYFVEYDLTPLLLPGQNAIGMYIGNGWYNQFRRVAEGMFAYGFPRLWFEITLTHVDGTTEKICSQEGLRYGYAYITENNLFYGETQDLRKYRTDWLLPGFDDSGWRKARPAKEREIRLEKQTFPADRVTREIVPKSLGMFGGKKLFDMGENISGWARLTLFGQSGDRVRVEFAEELNEEGTGLSFASAGRESQIQADTFICDGLARTVEPLFTWHGFRYCTVEGPAVVDRGVVVHTPLAKMSAFTCSDDVINWFFDAYERTQEANMHMCVPSDCPHRERLGYTGDGQLCAEAAMTVFAAQEVYAKWIADILDCQCKVSGHVQHTAPFGGGGGGPGGWGCAIVHVPYVHFLRYRDKGVLEKSVQGMCRWAEYMLSRSDGGLVVREEPYGWCLGDWCTPEKVAIPEPFVNTCLFIKSLRELSEVCKVLEIPFAYDCALAGAASAVEREYFCAETGSFAGGIQGADAIALDAGLGNEKTLAGLCAKYESATEFDTGIFGTDALIRVLFARDRADIALKLLGSTGKSSFGSMRARGATTIYETWSGGASHSHPMFGAAVASLFAYLAGVQVEIGGEIVLRPARQTVLPTFSARVQTHRGVFEVEYAGGSFRITSPIDTYMEYAGTRYALSAGANAIRI